MCVWLCLQQSAHMRLDLPVSPPFLRALPPQQQRARLRPPRLCMSVCCVLSVRLLISIALRALGLWHSKNAAGRQWAHFCLTLLLFLTRLFQAHAYQQAHTRTHIHIYAYAECVLVMIQTLDFRFSIFFFDSISFVSVLDILLLSRFFHWLCAVAIKIHSQCQRLVFV